MNKLRKRDKVLWLVKILLWCFPFFLFIWILDKNFIPSGKMEIKYEINESSKLVRNFASKEKDKLIGVKNKPGEDIYYQQITTSPLYFDVKIPRAFQKATVSLEYQNPNNQSVIKLGVKQVNEAYYYKDMALLHPVLENLYDHWDMISDGDFFLWQKNVEYYKEKVSKQEKFNEDKKELDQWYEEEIKSITNKYSVENESTTDKATKFNAEKKQLDDLYDEKLKIIEEENKAERKGESEFDSINQFLDNFPNPQSVLQYNHDLSSYLEMPGYNKSSETIVIDKSIRGKHEIYTYIGKGEDLNFIFTIQDINRHEGGDIFTVTVFDRQGNKINEVWAPDDGESHATGRVYPERRHQLLMEDIPFGVYRLVIDIPYDDIFIKKIETFQHLIMFRHNLYLTDNDEYEMILGDKKFTPTTVYTNSSTIKARTAHEKGLQILRIGYRNLAIEERHTLFEMDNLQDVTPVISPKNDIYLEGEGFFSFSRDQLFDLNYSKVQNLDDVKNIEQFDYIFANYPQAKEIDNWLVAKANVEAPYLYINEGKDKLVNFIISLPDLPEQEKVLKVKGVTILFEKEPITIKNVFGRIKNKLK